MLTHYLSTGFLFDIEGDWLRDDAEVARIDAYIRQLHNDKRVSRGGAVWEKMPLMFFVDGVFDRFMGYFFDRAQAHVYLARMCTPLCSQQKCETTMMFACL